MSVSAIHTMVKNNQIHNETINYLELDSELDQKATSTNYVNNKSDKL